MATQYKDGTFGETLPINEAMEKFLEAIESDTAKAFHVGSEAKIDKVKQEVDLQSQVDSLSGQLSELHSQLNSPIIRPTVEEITNVLNKKAGQ